MTKYLENGPFSVTVGETQTYRDNWEAIFGKKKVVLKMASGRYVAKDNNGWHTTSREGALEFDSREDANEASFSFCEQYAEVPLSDLKVEPA